MLSSCTLPQAQFTDADIMLQVRKNIVVPQGANRVYFQSGQLVNFDALDELQWYCFLEMPNQLVHPPRRVIAADSFAVTNKWRYRDVVYANLYKTAALTWWWHDQDASSFTYLWHLSLHSDLQPQVRALECGYFAQSHEVKWPGIEWINQILGRYAYLEYK